MIVDGSITASKIAVGTITADKIASLSITANQIAVGSIYGDRLVASTITGDKIAANTISAANIAAGSITADRLAASTITGDKIAAGQTLSSPTLYMGSVFINSGAAGFGKGGPYGAWGYGWNTIIYNNGAIYTNNLNCSNGTFTGTVNANAGTFNNVTIAGNCDVQGTIYADKIVGDVVAIQTLNALYSVGQQAGGTALTAFSCNIAASSKARVIDIGSISFLSTTSGVYYVASVYLNGSAVYTASTNAAAGVGLSFNPPVLDLPTGVNVSVTVTFKYLALRQSNVSVTVYPKNTGTFI